jgi:hypothetical protein
MTDHRTEDELPYPHRYGCFCVKCMATDRVNILRRELALAERALAALSKTRPSQADLRKTVTI